MSVIVGSVFIFRVFCRFICPLGALYGLFNKFAILGIKLDKPSCIDCGLCISKCKMDIKQVGDHECINCGECVGVCPTKAISWRGGKIILPPDEVAPITADMSEEEKTVCLENTAKSNVKFAKRRLITKIVAAVLASALLVSTVVYCNFFDKPAEEAPTVHKVGDQCPSVNIPVYNGNGEYTEIYNPAANKGKVTIINFWGVWCPGCIKELPYFDQIATDFSDSVDVIAIHTFDQMDESDEYIEEHFPDSKMLFGVDHLIKSGDVTSGEYLYTMFGGTGTYPITVIVDPNGEIYSLQQTELDYDTLAFYIMAAMANANN